MGPYGNLVLDEEKVPLMTATEKEWLDVFPNKKDICLLKLLFIKPRKLQRLVRTQLNCMRKRYYTSMRPFVYYFLHFAAEQTADDDAFIFVQLALLANEFSSRDLFVCQSHQVLFREFLEFNSIKMQELFQQSYEPCVAKKMLHNYVQLMRDVVLGQRYEQMRLCDHPMFCDRRHKYSSLVKVLEVDYVSQLPEYLPSDEKVRTQKDRLSKLLKAKVVPDRVLVDPPPECLEEMTFEKIGMDLPHMRPQKRARYFYLEAGKVYKKSKKEEETVKRFPENVQVLTSKGLMLTAKDLVVDEKKTPTKEKERDEAQDWLNWTEKEQ